MDHVSGLVFHRPQAAFTPPLCGLVLLRRSHSSQRAELTARLGEEQERLVRVSPDGQFIAYPCDEEGADADQP